MNKKLLTFTLALPLLMTAAASAQTVHMRVMVPFNFVAAGATLPAGEYDIQSFGTDEKMLAIRSQHSSSGLLVLSNSCESLNASSSNKLVFHRSGNRYFLAELWAQGHKSGRQVPPALREQEVAMGFPESEVVFLMARR